MPGFVQGTSKGVTSSGGTVTTPAFTSPTTGGNTIVVLAVTDASAVGNVTSVFDNYGNTYDSVTDLSNGESDYTMWYAQNITGGAGHTITMAYNISSASNAAIIAQEFGHHDDLMDAPLDVDDAVAGAERLMRLTDVVQCGGYLLVVLGMFMR